MKRRCFAGQFVRLAICSAGEVSLFILAITNFRVNLQMFLTMLSIWGPAHLCWCGTTNFYWLCSVDIGFGLAVMSILSSKTATYLERAYFGAYLGS